MIITTTEIATGYTVRRTLGLVRGSSVRVRHGGKDLIASLRNLARR